MMIPANNIPFFNQFVMVQAAIEYVFMRVDRENAQGTIDDPLCT